MADIYPVIFYLCRKNIANPKDELLYYFGDQYLTEGVSWVTVLQCYSVTVLQCYSVTVIIDHSFQSTIGVDL